MPASEPGAQLRPPLGLVLECGPEASDDVVILSFPLDQGAEGRPPLTDAEEATLAEVVLGCTNAEISARRGVSLRTVANQLAAVFRKLGVHSRLDAARIAAARMSKKTPEGVRAMTHPDSGITQVSGRSDNTRQNVTPFRQVDRMG